MFASTIALRRLLFPALLRPTNATSGTSESGTCLKCAALLRKVGGFRFRRKNSFARHSSLVFGGKVSQYQLNSSCNLLTPVPWPSVIVVGVTAWSLGALASSIACAIADCVEGTRSSSSSSSGSTSFTPPDADILALPARMRPPCRTGLSGVDPSENSRTIRLIGGLTSTFRGVLPARIFEACHLNSVPQNLTFLNGLSHVRPLLRRGRFFGSVENVQ